MQEQNITRQENTFKLEVNTAKEIRSKAFFTSEESIVKCTQGHATITINGSVHHFKTGGNFFLGDGMYLKVIDCSDDFEMNSYIFSLEFFNEIYGMIDNNTINVLWQSAPDLYSNEELLHTNMTIDKIKLLNSDSNCFYKYKILINLVLCYLNEVYEFTLKKIDEETTDTDKYLNSIMDKFFFLCRDYYTENRKVEFYANKLNISKRYLSKITKRLFQSTPKEMIDFFVVDAAKKLLLTSPMNNQQIADKLNFPDQATFGQFFKRNVGMPPAEFRSKYK